MEKSISCNIAIWLPVSIATKAIKISRAIKNRGVLFTLDNKQYYPHITLYMTEFPLKNIPRIEKKLSSVICKFRQFKLTSGDYQQSKNGYIDVSLKRSKEVADLQKAVVKALNPLRQGLIRSADIRRLRTSEKWQQKNIKLYGYGSIASHFRPHITFARLQKRKRGINILSDLPRMNFSILCEKVVLLKAGKHGVGREVIKFFSF